MASSTGYRPRPKSLPNWVMRLRDRVRPTYVDGCSLPDEPEPPYRARLRVPAEHAADGLEVTEREVVRGAASVVYEVRCACRRRWFQRRLERVQVCPRCGKAVLVERPD